MNRLDLVEDLQNICAKLSERELELIKQLSELNELGYLGISAGVALECRHIQKTKKWLESCLMNGEC